MSPNNFPIFIKMVFHIKAEIEHKIVVGTIFNLDIPAKKEIIALVPAKNLFAIIIP